MMSRVERIAVITNLIEILTLFTLNRRSTNQTYDSHLECASVSNSIELSKADEAKLNTTLLKTMINYGFSFNLD